MLESIISLDWQLMECINRIWSHPWLNDLLIALRNKYTWIPLYVFMASWFIYRFRLRGLVFILVAVAAIAIADTSSSKLVKKAVERPRPCKQDPPEDVLLIYRIDCGSGYSFTSSHATNHMALAVFIFCSLASFRRARKWRWLWLLWAFSVGYAQVYSGVHFPSDILGGFVLGGLIGYLIYLLYRKQTFAITAQAPPDLR